MTDTETDLLTQADIARRLGVTRQRAHQLADRPDFPDPISDSGGQRRWTPDSVDAFIPTWPRVGGSAPGPRGRRPFSRFDYPRSDTPDPKCGGCGHLATFHDGQPCNNRESGGDCGCATHAEAIPGWDLFISDTPRGGWVHDSTDG